uniref:EF-hand domain-containing protein n=1 Tax=Medicago truncatula TaxID=3880 RepID=I3SS42_MEDTR|nr:unknown [Medicago truncatula]
MGYSNSYLFLGLNLFVFLSSQALADIHVLPMLTVEPNLPSMTDQLNDKQISKIKAYFRLLDKDQDFSIDNDELQTLIRSLGLNPTFFGLMVAMNKFDADGMVPLISPKKILSYLSLSLTRIIMVLSLHLSCIIT